MDVAALYNQKLVKLEEQRELSSQMNGLLKTHLINGSQLACKNLTAAISASKSPGNFAYYIPSDDVKGIEGQQILKGMARRIGSVHNELLAIDNEISLAKAKGTKSAGTEEPFPGSLAAWQAKYSTDFNAVLYDKYAIKPPQPQLGLVSSFRPNSKIFGGTGHHKSFKTSSMQLIKGRCTR